MKIIPHEKYPNMYRIQWPDKTISVKTPNPDREGGHYGFYNKTRVKEIFKREGIKDYVLGKTYTSPMARFEEDG